MRAHKTNTCKSTILLTGTAFVTWWMVSVVYTAVRVHGSRKQGCASTSPVSCTINTAAEPCSLTYRKGCSFELYLAIVWVPWHQTLAVKKRGKPQIKDPWFTDQTSLRPPHIKAAQMRCLWKGAGHIWVTEWWICNFRGPWHPATSPLRKASWGGFYLQMPPVGRRQQGGLSQLVSSLHCSLDLDEWL